MHDRLTWTEQTLSLKCCQGTTSDYGEFFNEQYKCPISSTTNYTERGKQQQWWKTIVLHCLEDLICFIILSSLSAIMMLFLTTQTKEMVCNKNKQTNKQTTHTHTGSAGTFNCLSSLQMYFQQSCDSEIQLECLSFILSNRRSYFWQRRTAMILLFILFFVSVVCFTSYWHLIENKTLFGMHYEPENWLEYGSSLVIASFKNGQTLLLYKNIFDMKNSLQNATWKINTCCGSNLCKTVKIIIR